MRSTLALALGLSTALFACEGAEPENTTSELPAPVEVAPDPARWAEDAEDALRDDFGAVYARVLAEQVAEQPLRNVLLGEAEPVRIQRRRFLAHLYDEYDFAPVFVRDGALTPQGQTVLDALLAVGEHGLDPADYVPEALTATLDTQRQITHARRALPPVTRPDRDGLRALVDAVEALETDPGDAAAFVLSEALSAPSADASPLPALWRVHRERVALGRVSAGTDALVEALMMDGVLAYAFDQKNFNTSWVDEDLTEDERHELIAERTRETFQTFETSTDAASAQAAFDALQPAHPQYALLLAERARYAAIVEAGGWEPIDPRHVERGSGGSTVSELQARLAAEGYFDGEVDGVFGAEMEEAVRAYQTTHQMEVTGESSRGFWNSINVPAEDRLAQIELTLQRWRESRIGEDPYYVLVNVPDFHAEVWRNGNRDMRFRIVTGNTDQVCDPSTGRLRYANATPMQSATMTYVVLNPTWNVPRRIVEEELLPALAEDPMYFEEMGFERYTTSGGIEIVRQLPGPENPLGRVKFMFPNPHNTYMHDTSRPQYFQYPVRAFSHGCMRVQDPLDLLEYILTTDEQWEESRIERIFERGEETSVTLNTPIPVHIEYYVVRVDDEGRANFLADIYRLDRDRLNPPDSASLRCTVEEAGPRLVLGEGDVVMYEVEEGVQYTAEQWQYVQAGGTLRQLPDGSFEAPPADAPPAAGSGDAPGIDLDDPSPTPADLDGDFGP